MSAPVINAALTPAPSAPAPLATSTPLVQSSNQLKINPITRPTTPPRQIIPPQIVTTPPTHQIINNHNSNTNSVPLSLVQEKPVKTTVDLPKPVPASSPTSTPPAIIGPLTIPPVSQTISKKATTNGVDDSAAAKAPVNATLTLSCSDEPIANPAEAPEVTPAVAEPAQEPEKTPENVVDEVVEKPIIKEPEPESSNNTIEIGKNIDKIEKKEEKEPEKKIVESPKKETKVEKKPKATVTKRPRAVEVEEEDSQEKKPRRARQAVQPYQIPSQEITTVLNRSLKVKSAAQKSPEEKIIVFFRNEFLAVRNADNGFYLCQVLQNVYKTSHKIRIRWLSKDEKDTNQSSGVYTADFYDYTDFECILSNVSLTKEDKNKYKLPKAELERVENILKRAIDVEKGVSEKPAPSEIHPDGIDVSVYREELQVSKTVAKRKASPSRKSSRSPPKRAKLTKANPKTKKTQSTTEKEKQTKYLIEAKVVAKKSPVKKVTSKKANNRSDRKAAVELKVSPPEEKARVVARILRPTGASESPKTSSKAALKQPKGKKEKPKIQNSPPPKNEKAITNKNKKKEEVKKSPPVAATSASKGTVRGTIKRGASVSTPSTKKSTRRK